MDHNEGSADTLRILVTTDNHLGVAEKDGIRGSDSFRTFEEILHLAQLHEVDFIFFGGDIFHESRPSMHTVHETVRLLRQHCLGDRSVQFEILSDGNVVFANTAFSCVNHLDPNLNVSIPAFAIHGNHDDPIGPGGLCAVDILHSAGLVNLLGKSSSVERITISPLLLRKGSTRLALYALGAIREERAHRLFLNNLVTFYRPTEEPDKWFSIFAVHQNRSRHGSTSYLPEHFLPNFLDLVIWGHEHECRIEPEWNSSQNFFVTQPGSSVATTLSEGEAREKAVGLLEVRGKEFKITRVPLQTVRPFVFKDVILEDEITKSVSSSLDLAKQVEMVCVRHVEDSLTSVMSTPSGPSTERDHVPNKRQKISSRPETSVKDEDDLIERVKWKPPAEPLIRLRIDLSGGFESFSAYRFGQRFIGRVANPKDLISFNHNREKLAAAQARRALRSGQNDGTDGSVDVDDVTGSDKKKVGLDVVEVEKFVRRFLTKSNSATGILTTEDTSVLELFTPIELGHSLQQFIDKDSRDAIQFVVESIMGQTIKYLRVRKCPEERIVPDITSFCQTRLGSSNASEDEDGCSTLEAPDSSKTGGVDCSCLSIHPHISGFGFFLRDKYDSNSYHSFGITMYNQNDCEKPSTLLLNLEHSSDHQDYHMIRPSALNQRYSLTSSHG
ncbi:meiotic recombination, variant 2 [Clonorchis sinensis]|uniref:Double-strand break repair protein n=1 Tax=Clonorchis sinensis TaxID=79923 RepID=A0A8T1M7Z2_CLOSI|nr:meiotic recombination, variant 2 [Clonorchis sinensis]